MEGDNPLFPEETVFQGKFVTSMQHCCHVGRIRQYIANPHVALLLQSAFLTSTLSAEITSSLSRVFSPCISLKVPQLWLVQCAL